MGYMIDDSMSHGPKINKVLDIIQKARRLSRSDLLLKKMSSTAKKKDVDEMLETTARRAAALHSRQLAVMNLGLAGHGRSASSLPQLASD
jgi:hypothetical protein